MHGATPDELEPIVTHYRETVTTDAPTRADSYGQCNIS
jgi:hypothetical protein